MLAMGFSFSFTPSGKAVLNLPVTRSASGISLPEGLKLAVASLPDLVALALSTSIESGELVTSGCALSPGTSFTWKAPPNA